MSFDWQAFDAVLAERAPQMLSGLRAPTRMEDVEAAQRTIGRALPGELISAYLSHDGQEYEWRLYYAFFGRYRWLPLGGLVRSYLSNCELASTALERELELEEGDAAVIVQPDNSLSLDQAVRTDLWNPAWIPLAEDNTGFTLFVDLAPGPAGRVGQIVGWEPVDRARPVPIAPGFDLLLESLAAALLDGRITCAHNRDLPGWTEASSGEALYQFPCQV